MTNDFIYDMSEINEEEIFRGWEELANEEEYIDYEEDADWNIYGEEEFA